MDEIGVPHHQYYRWKKKYRDEDAAGIGCPERGSFVQLTPGGTFVPPMMSPTRTSGKSSNKVDGAEASFLTIELRTASGTAMRIQGSLTAAHLYNKPVDMRKSFNGLSGIVTNAMCERLRSGDVFIFVNSSRNMMKMLRQEEGGLVLYAIRLDMGRMRLPAIGGEEVVSTSLAYENVIGMVESALDSPYVRRMKLLSKAL